MARIGEAADAIVHDAFSERRRRLYGKAACDPSWRLPEKYANSPMQIQRAGGEPKRRWIDGTPMNTFYLWALAAMFPEARFIHNLRRPDEVATSLEAFDRVGAEPQELDAGLETRIARTPITHGTASAPSAASGRSAWISGGCRRIPKRCSKRSAPSSARTTTRVPAAAQAEAQLVARGRSSRGQPRAPAREPRMFARSRCMNW